MAFEFFKPKAKSPEQEKMNKQNRNLAIGVVAAGVVGAAGINEINRENNLPDPKIPNNIVAAESPASANTPTLGMKSTDAPKAIQLDASKETIPLDAHKQTIQLGEESVVIDPNKMEHQEIVKEPEH